jgi:hypothetical protein
MKLLVLADDHLDSYHVLLPNANQRCPHTHLAKRAVLPGVRGHDKFFPANPELHPRFVGLRHSTLVPVPVLLFRNSDSIREDEKDVREGQTIHRADSEGSCVQADRDKKRFL